MCLAVVLLQAMHRLGLNFPLRIMATLPDLPSILQEIGELTCRLWMSCANAAQAAVRAVSGGTPTALGLGG